MITSLFSKSKPINYIIVFIITLLAFIKAKLGVTSQFPSATNLMQQAVVLGIICVSILLLNFIVGKNNLAQKNNYEILLFSLFVLLIPQSTLNTNVIIANFFILLAMRRLISMRSQSNLKKKLFDAAFWMSVAVLFYFWSILFIFLIFAALLFYSDNHIKHWIIPFTGIVTVILISISYSIVRHDDFFNAFNFNSNIGFDFSSYNSIKYIVGITVLLSFGIWASIFYFVGLKEKMKSMRPSFKVILVYALIATIVIVLTPIKTGSEFLFIFAPASIIITNYIENISEKWFKESFLFVLVIIPFIFLVL